MGVSVGVAGRDRGGGVVGEQMNPIDWRLHAQNALKRMDDHELHNRPAPALTALYEVMEHLRRGEEVLKEALAKEIRGRVYGDDYAQVERESALG